MLATVARWLDRFAPPARTGAIVACLLFVAALGFDLVPLGVDAHAYWRADPLHPYNFGALYTQDAYFYSPAFTQALWPFHALPWPIFAALWTLALTAALTWLGGRYLGYLLLIPFVFIEMAMGNIHFLIAAPSTEKNASEVLQLPVRRVRYVSLLRTLGDDSFV